MDKTTMPELYRHMMEGPSIRSDRCVICGRPYPLEQHHAVWRSWGELYDGEGNRLPKPTLTVCGFGNNLPYCHGLIHHRLLHLDFRGGEWKWLKTERPMKFQEALAMDGWRSVAPNAGGCSR